MIFEDVEGGKERVINSKTLKQILLSTVLILEISDNSSTRMMVSMILPVYK